jgi:hypothetical protein
MTTATSSEKAIVFLRDRSSRSNPRVAWIVNGTIRNFFFGVSVSIAG